MYTVILPPGDNEIAVKKYINICLVDLQIDTSIAEKLVTSIFRIM